MLCARDRATGTMRLVSDSSFPTRREAIEAISGARDISGLSEADVFLVDLDVAVPVAVVSYGAREASPAADEARSDEANAARGSDGLAFAEAEPPVLTETADEAAAESEVQGAPVADSVTDLGEGEDEVLTDAGVRLGFVEIDIEAWTCEDCIYTATCAKVATIRPAECAAFQWRA